MSFTMDNVMEVLQIVKESKDSELHIDSGDIIGKDNQTKTKRKIFWAY